MDRLQQTTISDNRTQPLLSALARDRQASVDAAAAQIEARHITTVKSAYANIDTRKVKPITYMPPTSPTKHSLPKNLWARSNKPKPASCRFAIRVATMTAQKQWFGSPGGNAPFANLSGVLSPLTHRQHIPSPPSLMTFLAKSHALLAREIQTGPAAFDLLLQVLSRQFDYGDAVCSWNCGFWCPKRYPLRGLLSCFPDGGFGVDRQRARAPWGALDIVRLSVNERFPQVMPSLYPGELETCPLPVGSIDAMWSALGTLANNKTPTLNGGEKKNCLLRHRGGVFPPRRGPRLPP